MQSQRENKKRRFALAWFSELAKHVFYMLPLHEQYTKQKVIGYT
jgi:hypothetical protein